MSGRGTAAGMDFQAEVGGFLAALLLTARPLSRLSQELPGTPTRLLFEPPAPVDDIVVETDRDGVIHVQAKRSPSLSDKEPAGVADQFVRQFRDGKRVGDRSFPWDPAQDRLILAVSDDAPDTIKKHLREVLERNATGAATGLPQDLERARTTWSEQLASAWREQTDAPPSAGTLENILKLCRVVVLGTAQRGLALHILSDAVDTIGDEDALLEVLCQWGSESSSTGTGGDAATLRAHVVDRGIRLAVPADYRKDTARLKDHSQDTFRRLGRFRSLRTPDGGVRLARAVTAAVIHAASTCSFLVTGEPGAGKSAVLHAAAERLAATFPVVLLAVDETATSLDALRREIGLEHPIVDVLRACTDARPAFLVIDALDAARGGPAAATYRKLIEAVLALDGWRVIASVRGFDLAMGRELRETFAGEPPDPAFADPAFKNVSHLRVPLLTAEELAEVEAKAPAIATALAAASPKLKDLARNPFNLALLADLLAGGVDAGLLASVVSRGQLLERYWTERIKTIGTKGGSVLARLVERMVDRRAVEIGEADIEPAWAETIDELARRGVLAQRANRSLGFRHHVLFDYAVARLWLSAIPERARERLAKRAANGLLLAPAVAYWLEERFRHDPRTFWRLIIPLIADDDVDPVARVESARFVVEAVTEAEALTPLLSEVLAAPDGEATAAAVHILRAARDRLAADPPPPIAPWAAFVAALDLPPRPLLGELRSLITGLLEHPLAHDHRAELGAASRHLMDVLLADEALARVLSPTVVPLVARTFATDPTRSRARLLRLFEPGRFSRLGHVEVPWLAHDIGAIVEADPGFAAELYRRVFAAPDFRRDEPTPIATSWILSLTSNAEQDFKMAKYSLAEAYPRFLELAPVAAAHALAWTLRAARGRQRGAQERVEVHVVSSSHMSFDFEEDRSHWWARNVDREQIHDYAKMYQVFLAWTAKAPTEDLESAIQGLLANGRIALVWRVALEAGARRPEVLGDQLWPLASHPAVLLADETRCSAIRLIATVYPRLTPALKEDFEHAVGRFDYSRDHDAEDARDALMAKVFAAIGAGALVTEDARASLRAAEAAGVPLGNEPPVRDTEWRSEESPARTGADAEALRRNDQLEKSLSASREERTPERAVTVEQEVWRLREFLVREASALAPDVACRAFDTLARAAGELLAVGMLAGERRDALLDLLLALSEHPVPAATVETEAEFARSAHWGSPCPRLSAAEALARQLNDPNAYGRIAQAVERLALRDSHPAVRMMVVQRLNTLWEVARADMWRLMERVAAQEGNSSVLHFFTPVLARLARADPTRVEELFLPIVDRIDWETAVDEAVAFLLVDLVIARDLPNSKARLERWLADFAEAKGRLTNVLFALRDLLVLGYDDADEVRRKIRKRAQAFALDLVATLRPDAAAWLACDGEPTSREIAAVKLLDALAEQLFFGAGAAEELVVRTEAGRRAFLRDIEDLVRALADLGTPRGVHYLLQLLEPLVDTDPALCFDLISEALLRPAGIGRYEHEPLGASLFVKLVGRYLADHRPLFDEKEPRRRLVDCIAVFVDAGWPEARRLLQSLPDMLA